MIREYSWRDWMSVPQNRELYKRDMKEGLRQFKLEKKRRDDQIRYAEFLMERNRIQQIQEAATNAQPTTTTSAASSGGGGNGPLTTSEPTDALVTSFLAKTLINDSTIESSLDTFVKTLKAESLWSDMLLFYPFVTDKSTNSEIFEQFKFNLVNANSNKLTEFDGKFVGVTVSSNGISDFGDVNVLKTGFRPSSATTQFDDGESQVSILSGGYYLRTLTDVNFTVIADENASSNHQLFVSGEGTPDQISMRWPNTTSTPVSTTKGGDIGTFMISGEQFNDGESESYRVNIISSGGFEVAIDGGVLPVNNDYPLTLGKVAGAEICNNQISAYFIMNSKLSQAQMTTVRDAVNQLQTDLGRATHS